VGRDNRRRSIAAIMVLIVLLAPGLASTSAVQPKSTTVWSGTITLPNGYLVDSNQVLQIQAGTTVLMGDEQRLGVNGRISIQGTEDSPVTLTSISGDHRGILFNSSSNNKGSVIENLTITDSEYGVTVYSSNPKVNNLTVVNADRVAVDLFSSASPAITDLVVLGGGQDVHGSSDSWRYGIGISAGDYSAPIVERAQISNLVTRGVNLWFNSGGIWSEISVDNITGATLAASCAFWIEDSIPLFTHSHASMSDNGIIVRHISHDSTTRPTFHNTTVENSQYRGVLVERYDHTNYSNLQTNAIFQDIVVRGTGGPDAKSPGLGIGAAFDVNTSGVKLTNALIEENEIVGFRAYTTDSSTNLTNITIRNNGPESPATAHQGAGLLFRSTSWTSKGPAEVSDLLVENSTGSGVFMAKGGVIGKNWTIRESGAHGVWFSEFHPRVSQILSQDNVGNGVSVVDSNNVELSSVHTSGNGIGSSTSAGIFFKDSNYVMSQGKNVSCNACSSQGDQRGIVSIDSIDLQLISTSVQGSLSEPAIEIDNSGTIFPGMVIIDDMSVNSPSYNHSVVLNHVDAEISNLDISGEGGMFWKAKGDTSSQISNSVIWDSDSSCFDMLSHTNLTASGVSLMCQQSPPTLDDSFVSFSNSNLELGPGVSNSFLLNSSSHLRWISSEGILTPTYTEDDNILDIMWSLDIHTINQNLLNIPFATVNISFEEFEEEVFAAQPYEGFQDYGPFIGKRWTPLQGWSETNTANVGCDYDGVHNDTEFVEIDDDKRVYCRMELSNQPPFIVWQTPTKDQLFSSGSEINFDARESWDLDFDLLTYTWTSSIDGDIKSACPQETNDNSSLIVANSNSSDCLSDGRHLVTLEVCDSEGNCENETRYIELLNLPPLLTIDTDPPISPWGVLYLGETANVTINLEGTFDPEGDDLWCWVEASFEVVDPDPNNPYCPQKIVRSFTDAPEQDFTVSVIAFDGTNSQVSWTFEVQLFNEIPKPMMEITRNGQTSADWVILDGSSTIDPEGNHVRFEFHSDIDGLLGSGSSETDSVDWVGTLSKGTHNISMKASDDRSEHTGIWNSISELVVVSNSIPLARISSPSSGTYTDSSELIRLESHGSGDWDLSCSDLPENGTGQFCNPSSLSSKDLVSVLWESNQLASPLGGEWTVESRLPSGTHTVTLTLDDGSGPVSNQIEISVSHSPPVLALESPTPGMEAFSNVPVTFDFRESIDYDGDEFTVSVSSDIMGPILKGESAGTLYNEHLSPGNHNLTFELVDDKGMTRTHTQTISVLETGPISVISGIDDGQYLPPGQTLILSGAQSFDYDGDIVLYEWTLDGKVISDRQDIEISLQPGLSRIDLQVKDSRGQSSTSSINITVGSSAPQLHDLSTSVTKIEESVPTEVITTVRLDDPDGTTNVVRGELTSGGVSENMYFRDDGTNGDEFAEDGIWTSRFSWVVSGGSWVRVEVWAIDGELVSTGQVITLPIVEPERKGLESWVSNMALPILLASMAIFSAAGLAYRRNVAREIIKDMEVIESWSSFDPGEMDEELDPQANSQDPME